MKKIFFLVPLFISLSGSGQVYNQFLKFSFTETTKAGQKPVINTTMDIVINDTIKRTLKTDTTGSFEKIELPPGKYTAKIIWKGCGLQVIGNISLEEGKPFYYSSNFICPWYIESLTRKERKRLFKTFPQK